MAKSNPIPTPASVSYMDNPMAPDLYADEAVGFSMSNGVAKITLASARANHVSKPGPVNHVVIGRIVMPIQTAQNLAAGLFDFLKSHGVDPLAGRRPN
jgi:hypothetical protein